MKKNNLKLAAKTLLLTVALACYSRAQAGKFDLGEKFYGWSSNYVAPANFSGYEIWTPVSLNFKLAGGLNLFAQGEFGNAGYTDSLAGTSTTYFTAFSDTVAGGELSFKSFGVPSQLTIGFNIPTGNPTWEARQIAANMPTDLVNSRYQGRGFGVSGMYGLSFPAGSGEVGLSGGYMYSGAYNANLNLGPADNLDLGDALFLAMNHVQQFKGNQNQIIRLSGFAFLPTTQNGVNNFQMGPNINASYSWVNPKALSFSLGGQYFLPAQRLLNGTLGTEPKNSYGPRIYLNPSYAIGDFTLAGRAKYVFANGYALTESFYQGGGLLLGVEPSLKVRFDEGSSLKFLGSFDNITAQNAGIDSLGNRTNVTYSLWTFGTNYEVRF